MAHLEYKNFLDEYYFSENFLQMINVKKLSILSPTRAKINANQL
jgi:hypothetical protein